MKPVRTSSAIHQAIHACGGSADTMHSGIREILVVGGLFDAVAKEHLSTQDALYVCRTINICDAHGIGVGTTLGVFVENRCDDSGDFLARAQSNCSKPVCAVVFAKVNRPDYPRLPSMRHSKRLSLSPFAVQKGIWAKALDASGASIAFAITNIRESYEIGADQLVGSGTFRHVHTHPMLHRNEQIQILVRSGSFAERAFRAA